MCGTHALRIPDSLISDSTCPPLWQSWPILQWKSGNRVSEFHDFKCTRPRALPNPKLRCTCELSPPRHRFSVALSGIAKSRFLLQRFPCMRKSRNAEPRTLQDPWTRSFRLTALIASGNRGSRFLYARVSCLWKTRCSKCRLVQIS
jgi:hypothetical protein